VPPRDQQPMAGYNTVGPEFFATLGIPIVSGRAFTAADDERGGLVAIVDDTTAARFWRGRDPVGGRIHVKDQWRRIVGVARAIKSRNFFEPPEPFLYLPLRQNPAPTVALHIRTPLGGAALAPSLAREIHALDANIAPGEIITMREQVERTTATERIAVTMLIVCGGVALFLAAIGLYGVISATVAQNSRQLALRMALGADAAHVRRLVLTHGLAMAAGGIALGAATTMATTRLLGYLLYRVDPRDPAAFALAIVVVLGAAVAACVGPVRRATKTDPLHALRA